jgi:hypothetical protein
MKNRISRRGLALVLLAVPLAPAVGRGADTPARPALPPAALVARLGDDSFEVREEATVQLARLARAAVPALEEGLKHPDREVRSRCEQLLARARRSDLDIHLDAFVLDPADKSIPPLPGWKKFQELAGNDLPARLLFARLARADRALLEQLEKNPAQLAGTLNTRLQRLMPKAALPNANARADAPSVEVASLLLVACAGTANQQLFDRMQNLFYQPAFRAELLDNPASRRLAARILGQHRGGDVYAISQVAWMAQHLQLTELIEGKLRPALAKFIEDPKLGDDLGKLQQAVYLAGTLGMTPEIEARLKPLVRKLAASAGDERNPGKFQQAVQMAQQLQMQDLIDQVLKPAAYKQILVAAEKVGDQGQFWQARYAAQTLGLNDLFEATVKPAASKVIAEAADHPGDINKFHNALYLAQNLNLQEAMEGALKPAARQHILAALEQPGDVNRLQQAVQMARSLNLQEMLNDTVKPVVRRQAAALAAGATDLNNLTQLHYLAQSLGAGDVTEDHIKPALRKYFASAKDKPIDPNFANQGLQLARTLRLKEAIPLAFKAAQSKDVNTWARGNAIFFIGEVGTKEEVARLEGLLGDTTVIGSAGINWTTVTAQVRDVALAMLLHTNGQNLAEYGYPYFQIVQGIQPFQTSPGCVGFADDAGRDAAFKKWKEWQGKQKK